MRLLPVPDIPASSTKGFVLIARMRLFRLSEASSNLIDGMVSVLNDSKKLFLSVRSIAGNIVRGLASVIFNFPFVDNVSIRE